MPRFKFVTISLAVLGLIMPAVANAESWLCIADQSTGFSFDKATRKWSVAKFNVSDTRYLVVSQNVKDYPYTVKNFDSNEPLLVFCKDGFTAETFLRCKSFGGDFTFNVKTLRYFYTYNVGYINPTPGVNDMKEGDDTPFMEIGRCSRLQ